MWMYSIVTYLHFMSIFMLFSALIVELSIIKEKMTSNHIKILRKANLFFGVFAGLTVVTGLLRMYYFGKGVDYYSSNSIFVVKFSLFIIVGFLSIYPTIQFFKLGKFTSETVGIRRFKNILFIIKLELVLLLLIPFLGVLVAKGIGL
ncbi:MAG: hypothetical protein COB60_02635 [Flavobacteriaceae bacterium]|nr:MAG: hypothetical protein COB60_02635 [Flavobacteriaceae bacterium]